jgi:hypothetical protein
MNKPNTNILILPVNLIINLLLDTLLINYNLKEVGLNFAVLFCLLNFQFCAYLTLVVQFYNYCLIAINA